MANILLGVTGSVAAIRTPELYLALTQAGHAVKVVATEPALHFFDALTLPPDVLHRDADEWRKEQYQRDDPVLHIELRKWADLLLVAPLDANTLAKFAQGLSDNCLTCVYRAWNPAKPILIAPAMNTFMWDNPLTRRHLRWLMETHEAPAVPATASLSELTDWINQLCPRLRIIGPQSKRLACGDVGMGGMAEVADIVQAIHINLTSS